MLRPALSIAFIIALVVILAACQTGAGGTPSLDPVLIDSVDLDSYSLSPNPTATGPMLETGKPYRLLVSGNYSLLDLSLTTPFTLCKGISVSTPRHPSPSRINGPVFFDARYRFAMWAGEEEACAEPTTLPLVSDGFQVSLDGGVTFNALTPAGGTGFSAEHEYTYDVTGGGHAVRFRITDPIASDNYGVLKIDVFGFE
jgi:hypothetical protein